jgi:hypothetical protein
MEAGSNFRIDAPWSAFLRDRLVDDPVFWSK